MGWDRRVFSFFFMGGDLDRVGFLGVNPGANWVSCRGC